MKHFFRSVFLLGFVSVLQGASSSPVNLGSARPDAASNAIVQQATADFQAVLAGKRPVHAQADPKAPLPADGGTTFFKANGYSLTIVKSLVRLAGVDGYLYGPVIRFDVSVANGNSGNISQVAFYSREELSRLMANPAP